MDIPQQVREKAMSIHETLSRFIVYHLPKTTQRGREVPMPSDEEVTQRAGSLRSLTGLPEAEFQALLPPFEQAFVAYMQDRTSDRHPRLSRHDSTSNPCPLPTIADQWLFILTYLKLLWFNRNGHRDKRGKMGRGGVDSCPLNGRCIQPSSNEKRCP